jgi:hypothetical protein
VVVAAPEPTPFLVPPLSYRPFLATRGADIRLEYTEEPIPLPDDPAPIFDSGSVWQVHRRGTGLLYTFRTRVADPPLYKALEIDAPFSRGRLYFPKPRRGRRPRWALAYPLDDLLFQHRLAREGAAEVHAFGVVLNGRTALFCGQSGAGKSTLARLFCRHDPRAPILSDDRIVLRADRRGFLAHGTPWHGEALFAAPLSRPLGGVFFLKQSKVTRVVPLRPAEAAGRLFARTFPPPWDGPSVERVLALSVRVAETVPCFELRFRRDGSAVRAARAALVDSPGGGR